MDQTEIKKPNLSLTKKLLGVFIGMMLVFIVIGALAGNKNDSKNSQTPQQQAETMAIGETGYLKTPNNESTMLGTTKENFDRIVTLSMAGDNTGLENMVASGAAFLVDNNTQAKLISTNIGAREVRIIDGKFAGQSGWTAKEFLTK